MRMKTEPPYLIQKCDVDQSLAQSRLYTLLGLNIRSLGFHHDKINILLSNFEQKPVVLALTETWIAANDPLEEYDILGYQPIESTPKLNLQAKIRRCCILCQRWLLFQTHRLQYRN